MLLDARLRGHDDEDIAQGSLFHRERNRVRVSNKDRLYSRLKALVRMAATPPLALHAPHRDSFAVDGFLALKQFLFPRLAHRAVENH